MAQTLRKSTDSNKRMDCNRRLQCELTEMRSFGSYYS